MSWHLFQIRSRPAVPNISAWWTSGGGGGDGSVRVVACVHKPAQLHLHERGQLHLHGRMQLHLHEQHMHKYALSPTVCAAQFQTGRGPEVGDPCSRQYMTTPNQNSNST